MPYTLPPDRVPAFGTTYLAPGDIDLVKAAVSDIDTVRLPPLEAVAGYRVTPNAKIVNDPTCTSASAVVTFGAPHGIVTGDVGKTCWIVDTTGGFGTQTTILSRDSTTQITMAATAGKTQTAAGQFVYGSTINTALTTALSSAGAATTVDTGAGVNAPWGPVGGEVVNITGGTGVALLTTTFTVPAGVMLNADGCLLFCRGNSTTPTFTFASNSSFGRLHMAVGGGKALTAGNSTSSQAHLFGDDLVVWADPSASNHLIEFDGLDFQIGRIWTKGGNSAVRLISGTDCRIGHLFAIGAATGLALSQASQVTCEMFADSCTVGARMWSGVDNVHLRIQEFKNSAAGGDTRVVVFGEKDDGTTTGSAQYINNDVTLDIQSRDAGNNVLELNYCQNVKANIHIAPAMAGTGLSHLTDPSVRGQTTFVAYGTSVGDGISVEVSAATMAQLLVDGTTKAYVPYSGTPVGTYTVRADGTTTWYAGNPMRRLRFRPASGVETFPIREDATSSNTVAMTAGQPRFTSFYADDVVAITQVQFWSGSTASTGLTSVYAQLHTVDASGNLTRIATASQTSSPTWLSATNTGYTTTFGATIVFDPLQLYCFELLAIGGTPGNVVGFSIASGGSSGGLISALSPRRTGAFATQTAGQASYSGASVTNTGSGVYALFS